MIDIQKELKENKVILGIVPGVEYNELTTKIAKKLSNKSVCYVSLNKTFDSLKEQFKKKHVKLDNIVFIDAISKTIKDVPSQTEGCYYVSSPGSLTELSIVISKVIRHGFKYIVFDSLTNLMIYEKKSPVAKFMLTLVNKIRESKTKAIFLALDVDEHKTLIQETSMYADKVVKFSENSSKK